MLLKPGLHLIASEMRCMIEMHYGTQITPRTTQQPGRRQDKEEVAALHVLLLVSKDKIFLCCVEFIIWYAYGNDSYLVDKQQPD